MRRKVFPRLLAAAALLCVLSAGAAAQEGSQAASVRVTLDEFKTLLAGDGGVVILDVRHEAPLKIKGAKHIPLDALDGRTGELPAGREIVTYCA